MGWWITLYIYIGVLGTIKYNIIIIYNDHILHRFPLRIFYSQFNVYTYYYYRICVLSSPPPKSPVPLNAYNSDKLLSVSGRHIVIIWGEKNENTLDDDGAFYDVQSRFPIHDISSRAPIQYLLNTNRFRFFSFVYSITIYLAQ